MTLTGTEGLEIAAHNVLVIVESKTEKSFVGSCGMHSQILKSSQARSEYAFVQAQIPSKSPFVPNWTPNLKSTKPASINYNYLYFGDGFYMIPVSKAVNLSFVSYRTVVFHNPTDFSGKIYTADNKKYTDILGDTNYVGTNLTKTCTITITPKSESKILSFSVLSVDNGRFSDCETFDVFLGSDTYFLAGSNDGQAPLPVNMTISQTTSSCIWFTSHDTF
ncbi:hypothetical protein TVAG_178510 [Trichomonas vaginalis G3]|uniref:Uncharacterized protein n=1 Tax=Trichomonas vaginalis (strain ATCC PRA-98 / G3) TaxID=412133 RepID=A2DIK3_TRIV3|nr:hypothetical protein TVAGG3_0602540 [Trichomonas vaginalis G3]EAY19807.1 hypothetical protein TVAG_178510 [Trichomonas vaginalis G3]KAI5524010.1 hypothetical protein TVAGG3_0602540 [Trichomonas vaginalis G3]|eukprot:XP_001580793.1 hypothetical protein [Trichomonas vaginalis G3]